CSQLHRHTDLSLCNSLSFYTHPPTTEISTLSLHDALPIWDYAEALAAADKAKPLLWAAAAQIQLLDYFYYTALAVAALHEKAARSEEHTSELQSRGHLVCRLLLEKKKKSDLRFR